MKFCPYCLKAPIKDTEIACPSCAKLNSKPIKVPITLDNIKVELVLA